MLLRSIFKAGLFSVEAKVIIDQCSKRSKNSQFVHSVAIRSIREVNFVPIKLNLIKPGENLKPELHFCLIAKGRPFRMVLVNEKNQSNLSLI